MFTFARIDDRLIHGQVVTSWLGIRGGRRIIVHDDQTAKDPFMVNVCKRLAPMGTTVEVYGDDEGVEIIKALWDDPVQKCVWLAARPHPIMKALEAGIPLKELIVGGMGKRGTRWKIYRNVCADQEERDMFNRMNDEFGCKVYGQILPRDKPIDLYKAK